MGLAVDAVLPAGVESAGEAARRLEAIGYRGLWVTEGRTDPFLDLALPALQTTRPLLGTAIAVAFARSPFVTATLAWQLQALSKGRFVLGLGTQVKGHIERRFGMPWGSPGPKLREYVQAVKALFRAFQQQEPLRFEGRFYTHTLLTPFFDPGPIPYPPPPVWVAAVNEYNAETVGLVADGCLVHPVHSPAYLREVLLPAIGRGLARAGRRREEVTVLCPVFLIPEGEGREEAERFVRAQVAFYGSTRTYRRVFELHGWGDVPGRLHERMAAGDLEGMASLITPAMLEQFAVLAPPEEVAPQLRARYEGLADRVYVYNLATTPLGADEERQRELIAALAS